MSLFIHPAYPGIYFLCFLIHTVSCLAPEFLNAAVIIAAVAVIDSLRFFCKVQDRAQKTAVITVHLFQKGRDLFI